MGPGEPSFGGTLAVEALDRIERHDLAALGHYTDSAEAFYHLLRATRRGLLSGTNEQGGNGI